MTSVFYPYRIFLRSGHSFQVYRHEDDELKVWESVKKLRGEDGDFVYFHFNEGNTISGVLDPNAVIGLDRPFGIKPEDLDERKKSIEEARAKASKQAIKTNVGSNAIDITRGK